MNDASGLLDEIMAIPGVDCAVLFANRNPSGGLKLLAHDGLSPDFVQESERLCEENPARVGVPAERIWIRNFVSLMREPDNSYVLMEGIRSILVVPIRNQTQMMGALHVASRRFSIFEPATVTAVEAAASRLKSAIDGGDSGTPTVRK